MCTAARVLNIHPIIISNYFSRKQTKPYKNRNVFKQSGVL